MAKRRYAVHKIETFSGYGDEARRIAKEQFNEINKKAPLDLPV